MKPFLVAQKAEGEGRVSKARGGGILNQIPNGHKKG